MCDTVCVFSLQKIQYEVGVPRYRQLQPHEINLTTVPGSNKRENYYRGTLIVKITAPKVFQSGGETSSRSPPPSMHIDLPDYGGSELLQAGLEKTRVFLYKKTSPLGFFFWGGGFRFLFFFYLFSQNREFKGFFKFK
jgi:hypothetical protein